MPEGDSIYQLSRRLQFLIGREVTATSIRVPKFALADFTGATTDRIWPYGKHLFMQFGREILHTHLKMEGNWAIHLKGDKWTKPGHTARVVLNFSGAPHPRPIEIVGHQLGFVRVFPTEAYHEHIAHLGPDVLADNWENHGKQEAFRRLLLRPDRPIGTALLDQRNLAGIGNEYRAEICFVYGCHPATKVEKVDVDRILDLARELMWANRLSPLRVTTGVRRVGESTYVFGRNNQPCRRCGRLISKGFLGGAEFFGDESEAERVIWWCENCQPLL